MQETAQGINPVRSSYVLCDVSFVFVRCDFLRLLNITGGVLSGFELHVPPDRCGNRVGVETFERI